MATGDYHFTAIAVARGVGMVPPQAQVIIIQTSSDIRAAGSSSTAPALAPDTLEHDRPGGSQMVRLLSAADQLCTSISSERLGLTFRVDNGEADLDAMQALTAIAQVSQCKASTAFSCLQT